MARSNLITGNVWEQYSNKVIDRMNNPRYLGELTEKEANQKGGKLVVADFGSEACGDAVRLYWIVDPKTNKIIDAKFKSFGCGTAIASSDMMTELTIGKTVDEAMRITNIEVEKALRDNPDVPAFPPQKMHCSVMAYDVIIEASAKYKGVDPEDIKNSEIVCECARVTKKEIEDIVRTYKVRTVEELQKYTDAGTYCRSCVAKGGHEERSIYLVDIIDHINKELEREKFMNQSKSTDFDNMTLLNKIRNIEKILDKDISSILQLDGGSVELIDVRENNDGITEILIKYLGTCSVCNAAVLTLHMIEKTLKEKLKTEKIKLVQV